MVELNSSLRHTIVTKVSIFLVSNDYLFFSAWAKANVVAAPACRVRVKTVQFPWACNLAHCGEAPTGKCWREFTIIPAVQTGMPLPMATITQKRWTKAMPTGTLLGAPSQRPPMTPTATFRRVSWRLKVRVFWECDKIWKNHPRDVYTLRKLWP